MKISTQSLLGICSNASRADKKSGNRYTFFIQPGNKQKTQRGFTLLEVLIASGVTILAMGVILSAILKGTEIGKWQSSYQTACSYGEQALEYALYVPYTDFSNTNNSMSSINWISNGYLYTSATGTNFIPTVKHNLPYLLTNITFLATQETLPLDDLGSYILNRFVILTPRSAFEPAETNLNYVMITVSNTWVFRSRTMPPIVFQTIRDQP